MNKPQKFDGPVRGSIPVFFYGTLTHPRTRDYVLKHKDKAVKALLPSYKREMFKTPEGTDFPTVTPAEHSKVSGDLIMASKDDFHKLKEWENQYNVNEVKLDNGTNAYIFILKKRDEIKREK